jgi:hypothetical protein
MTRILAAGLALLALAAWLRRPHVPPPPSRPFPLNGRIYGMGLEEAARAGIDVPEALRKFADMKARGYTYPDGDWLDETPVPEYRRRGAL